MKPATPVLILYDGDCPVCRRKAAFLQRQDHRNRLRFGDIRGEENILQEVGIPKETLEKHIHAILPDGTVTCGMEAIRAIYREIGLGWIAAPTGWPGLKLFFDLLYGFTARHRHLVSRLLPDKRR